MAQLPPKILFPKPRDLYDQLLQQAFTNYLNKLVDIINGGIRLSDNEDSVEVAYSSNAIADTEDTVAHTLGRTPVGFRVVNINKGGVVYDSGTSWTSSNIYLKCTTSSTTATLRVF